MTAPLVSCGWGSCPGRRANFVSCAAGRAPEETSEKCGQNFGRYLGGPTTIFNLTITGVAKTVSSVNTATQMTLNDNWTGTSGRFEGRKTVRTISADTDEELR